MKIFLALLITILSSVYCQAEENSSKDGIYVILFKTSTCTYCIPAEAEFKKPEFDIFKRENSIKSGILNITTDERARKVHQYYKMGNTVPSILVVDYYEDSPQKTRVLSRIVGLRPIQSVINTIKPLLKK